MPRLLLSVATAALLASPAHASPAAATKALVEEKTIPELQAAMIRGDFSAEELTRAAIARIHALDGKLHSVIAVNPDAISQARAADIARRAGGASGPMAGIPVLIKDNVETRDPMPTTAGSLALKDNLTGRDSPSVAKLRAAGAVILGKTNLSEWANIRSTRSMSGWSAIGGLVANPYDLTRTACGSSSGSGASIAASFAPVAIGTETDGSVTCPSAMNGLVGLKPTVGLVSRTHVVPISHSQDTPGPMGRSVMDIATLLTVMAGSDPADKATAEADAKKTNYVGALSGASLKGVRIGVLRDKLGGEPKTLAVFDMALKSLEAAGAVLVNIKDSSTPSLDEAEFTVLKYELKADLNAYLSSTPAAVKTRTLADVIAFNSTNSGKEMPFFRQEIFEMAEAKNGLDDLEYVAALARSQAISATRLDGLLKDHDVTFLIAPTYAIAWKSDTIYGDVYNGPSATQLPATSGYPHLTVPMGFVQGLPVGLSFMGAKWSDVELLKAGYVFEQATKARKAPDLR
jgi:amidase